MRRYWKWSAIALGGLAALALAAAGYIYAVSEQIISHRYPLRATRVHASADLRVITLGQHLVRLYGCADCHRPSLQGAYIADFGMWSRNLTRLTSTFSDADFDRAIRQGLRPNGTSLAETMPSDSFQYMPQSDVVAIISYIRSLTPSGQDIPEPSYDLKSRWGILHGTKKVVRDWFPLQKPALDLGPRYARGRQMAMTACGECHGTALEGQGGGPHTPPNLSIVASYDRADFVHFMRTGKAAGNRELPMMSQVARVRVSRLPDAQMSELYDYLVARGRKLTGMVNTP